MRLLLVALALCLATPAWAKLTVYSHLGRWDIFKGTGTDGRQVCGIGNTNPTDGRAFSLRYALGADNVIFVAAKPTWDIPKDLQVPVVMQIGLHRPWSEQAVGHGHRLEWSMNRETVEHFDREFRRARSMTVTFPSGSERPWVVSLRGSSAASSAMGRCVTAMTQNASDAAAPQSPTQPFGPPAAASDQSAKPDEAQPASTQPSSPAPSSPTPLQTPPR